MAEYIMRRFEGKIAVVTGGANGIGRGMITRLLKEGAKCACIDIEGDTMAEVWGGNEDVFCVTCDVAYKDQVDAAIAQIIEHYGRIDLLFNNAGIVCRESLLGATEEGWRRTFDVNVHGVFFVAQAVLKHMVDKGIKGNIVNTSSQASQIVSPNTGAYAASKHAVTGFTKWAAMEMAPYGIRVNAIGPGTSVTRMTEATRNDPERLAMFMRSLPLARLGEVEDQVAMAMFLASDEASYITGVTYLVSGGSELF